MLETVTSILAAVSLTPTDGIMIVVCTGLVFLLYKALEVKVFTPLIEHIEQRESLTSGAVHTAAQMRQKSQALKERFDEAIFKARVQGNTKRSEIVAAAKDKASTIIRQAENEAAKELATGRQQIANQIANARTGAEVEAQELAKRIANQVDLQLSQGA